MSLLPHLRIRLCASSVLAILLVTPVFGQEDGLQLHSPTGSGLAKAPEPERATAPREFGAVGRLQRVKRNDTGSMRFAVLDRSDTIIAFLAPTSRFELQQLVGEEVAITGRTLSHQDDIAPYVMIEEITSMSGQAIVKKQAPQATPIEREIRQASYDEFEELPPAQLMSHEQPTPAPIESTGYDHEEYLTPMDGCACSSCGEYAQTCTSCGVYRQCGCCDCGCGPPGWLFLRGEYLLWWTKGMDAPPLVTSSPAGTPVTQAGVLGTPGVEILYGNDEILDDARSGYRIRFGGFLGPCRRFGWEGEYFSLTDSEFFSASGDGTGNPIISRPFFNVNPRNGAGDPDGPPRNDAELVSFPDILRGEVTVATESDFQGAAGRLRYNICCKEGRSCGNGCTSCTGGGYGGYGGGYACGYPPFCRVDFTAGYRFYGLDESLVVTEDLTSLQADNPGRFEIFDRFDTQNEFHGGEIGMLIESGVNRWTLDFLMRMAIGSTRQEVSIAGETIISPLVGPSQTFTGGLLAQRSNIGSYSQNEFTLAPEINANLGFYLTPRLRALVGYSLIYWGNVVRPGDQIDLDVNPDLLPPENDPFQGPLRPEFVFRTTDFWAHGLNVGLDLRW